jgi:hypothetical protein
MIGSQGVALLDLRRARVRGYFFQDECVDPGQQLDFRVLLKVDFRPLPDFRNLGH